MARTRSPNYPCISLPEALAKTAKIYEKENRSVMSRLLVAHHLGYGSLHGISASQISALRKYGLLEGRGDELRVSPDAVDALTDPRDARGRAALRRAAFRPEVFAQLASKFGEPPPSAENLQTELRRRGFKDDAARSAAQAYLETVRFVEEMEASPAPGDGTSRQDTSGGGGEIRRRTAASNGGAATEESPVALRLPLPGDNWAELKLGRKLSHAEYQSLQPLLTEILKSCLTDPPQGLVE